MRAVFVVVRILGAAAIICAVAGQLATSLRYWASAGVADPSVQLANFFSFFTIDSNLLAMLALAAGAAFLIGGRRTDSRWFAVFRLSVTSYMTVTLLVYNVLLRSIELPQGATLAWSNEILHVAAPLLVIFDWLCAPGRRRLPWTAIWSVIAFPLAWSIYTMIRGPLTHDVIAGTDHWYPYPFLNPELGSGGYLTVALYIVAIALLIGGVAAAAVWVSRRGRWPLPATRAAR
ncbi:Pr6Pr family membrane protein [Gryllotalpicola reticulitermitis]|uniref:Pr6Pr family membrane protein n=1 Tax=Gryllotalpicola reticulitermitis TaxID=1184153 RepID=A0ABV8QC16_9MICO